VPRIRMMQEAERVMADFNGTSGMDFITGTAEDDYLEGLDGDDSLHGLGGDDNGKNGDRPQLFVLLAAI